MKTRHIVLSGLFVALGLVLPFFTGQIPSIGNKLLPMHLPIFLCGFILGGPIGLAVGLITPILRSVLFGMPPFYPVAISMSLELATYGGLTGFLFKKLSKNTLNIYLSLVMAMIAGRIIWGVAMVVLLSINGAAFTLKMFLSGALINSTPGLIAQIIIIPVLLISLRSANLLKQ